MAQHASFDGIYEPNQSRTIPAFLRMSRPRRSRAPFYITLGCLLLLLAAWKSSPKLTTKSTIAAKLHISSKEPSPYTPPNRYNDVESPLLAPETTDDNRTTPMGLHKTNPSFHLLIPATRTNPQLCKTLLSSFVLAYPPPTLINYGKEFNGDNWDKGSHAGKIRGVYDYLNNKDKIADEDMVLIVDGYDAWFQLPPVIMIKRYHTLVSEANDRLRRRYGTVVRKNEGERKATEIVPRYSQSIVFGADKLCWPNPQSDPACAAVPYSTLPKDVYGPATDNDPDSFNNRPRFLNSGTIMGPAKDVRAVYEAAVAKVEKENRGTIGDQFVFAEIFGEQEYQREVQRQSTKSTGGKWYEWISNALGGDESPLSANQTIKNMTAVPGRRYEFGIGLDYESKMFQTMTHSAHDIEFFAHNDSSIVPHILETHPNLKGNPFAMPFDIQMAPEHCSAVSFAPRKRGRRPKRLLQADRRGGTKGAEEVACGPIMRSG
ncbi:MAG: hypothetical protein Q9218_006967 [Villophora microphyllina]